MFWVIAAVVLVGFGALLWWWSGTGEATPPRPERERSGRENDHIARSKGGGFSGM